VAAATKNVYVIALGACDGLAEEGDGTSTRGYRTDTLILASIVETDQHSGRHRLVQRAPMRLSGEVVYPAGKPPGWIAGRPGPKQPA
jgi:hypothetical protein